MKQRYRVFLRPWGVYYCEDLQTGKQETLKTRDKDEAYRIVAARNETEEAPAFSLHLARVYWQAGDPDAAKRTWQNVMNEIPKFKTGDTHRRWLVAIKDKAFDSIRNLVILETKADHFLKVLEKGSISTNIYLRRIHNFALDMSWLPVAVLPKKRWPAIKFKAKRAITLDEHQKIIAREPNAERKAFYQLAWQLGASQSDIAFLEAKDINWEQRVVAFHRKKTGTLVLQSFDDETAALLKDLPSEGPLFSYLRTVRAGDRATEFKQRCGGLGIKGVTLHCYRYAWAQRARKAGMPVRFAQDALGQNSKAVHFGYADLPEVKVPTLSEYEKRRAMFAQGKVTELEPVAEAVNT
ncbi:MAG TPA: tyrosine-type recombinase/integrase [Verrucomicrobiae bacterium]|nr:tyrosine-type recombinase/integrase [Verrucomicrobiae bacterium]